MCNPPNSNYSFYGKLSASWAGGMTPATSLKPWLDPSSAKFNDGDPHITTADGNHYNFQGAGEYVSLRNAGLEIQTRQAPVATTFNPEADPHDGLATCVSINTAVAARVGSHRVTYEPKLSSESDRHGFQPNPEGWPDQSGFQLRVDGHPITLGPAGLDLAGGGRIAPIGAPGDIEIDFPDHNALQVTLGQFEGKTDLFLQVSRLPVMGGTEGVAPESGLMGPIAKDSWLPALPDGTPVPMPPSYTGLYQTFGEAWRVKDKASSLFDYASGESPDAFSNPKWPPEIPPNWPPEKPRCLISGTTPLEPASEPVAQEACHQITGKNMLADCIFDVRVTGNTGFAKTYLAQQQLQFGATKTTVEDDKDVTKYGRIVTFTATVGSAVSRIRAVPTGTVQFKLDGRPVGSPVELKNGRAERSTSDPPQVDLPVGIHQIEASYIPSDDSLYLASVSPYESHVVLGPFNWYLWLAILLLIIVLILLVWWYLRTS